MNHRWYRSLVAVLLVALVTVGAMEARTKDTLKGKNQGDQIQRDPTGPFDQQLNVVSNFEFYTTNYGIFGFDVRNSRGGGIWPRGSQNQYLFATGAWFAALKRQPNSDAYRKRVMVTYNPNSGNSWMAPGTIEDGKEIKRDADGISKYRTYFSTDFNASDGTPFLSGSPNWPVWDSDAADTLRVENYYGKYINDITARNKATYAKGPAFISEEDIFAVYKDTDLNLYEGGTAKRQAEGYPLGFQIEQTIYSWGFGDYRDMVFLKYMFIHPESYKDTLFQCWMGGLLDVDITLSTNFQRGASNDKAKFYDTDSTLNLAVQWTNGDQGEANQGFGYLGFNFLESPAVDADGFLRKDKRQFPVSEQLGMRTFRNWPIAQDPLENEDRYNFMAANIRDGDALAGDIRLLMATGPFNVRPGDSARIVIGIILGETATGKDATGTDADMVELIRKVRFAQFVYDNQFRAPRAPDYSIIKGVNAGGSMATVPTQGWLPLNNAMVIQWDSTSEMSIDTLERGLDFFGYRIYRARRTDLDSFNVDEISSRRLGPLGWKQIGRYEMMSPFIKSDVSIPNNGINIDEFRLADPITRTDRKFLVARSPSTAGPWATYFFGLLDQRPVSYDYVADANRMMNVSRFDKFDSVRFVYFTTQFDSLPEVRRNSITNMIRDPWLGLDSNQSKLAHDSLVKLILARRIKMVPFLFKDTVMTPVGPDQFETRIVMRPWEETNEIRRGVIARYMRSITNGRTFYDQGDDNGDGRVLYAPNPNNSEKLINNIDYYYAVRAYDEGDYLLPTPPKLNTRAIGLPNVVKTTPLASRPGDKPSVTILIDSANGARLGGIYNIRLLIQDEQRFNQIFGGRSIELEFYRTWFGIDRDNNPSTPNSNGLYALVVFMRDSATKQLISNWFTALPPELCPAGQVFSNTGGAPGYFTENTYSWVDGDTVRYDTANTVPPRIDTVNFGVPTNRDKVIRYGNFYTNASCFNAAQYALGTVGLAFDYAIQQWGGVYRTQDSVSLIQGPQNVYIGPGRAQAARYSQNADNPAPAYFEPPFPGFRGTWDASYNNGPGIFEVEFLPGGQESIQTEFVIGAPSDEPGKQSRMTFNNVEWLDMRVRNLAEFDRQEERNGSIVTEKVHYPFDYRRVDQPIIDTLLNSYPRASVLRPDEFSIGSFGFRNTQNGDNVLGNRRFYAAQNNTGSPIGTVGRYYRSRALATTGKDTLDFLHILVVGGAQYVIDYSWKGRRSGLGQAVIPTTPAPPATNPTEDFKAGDKVRFFTLGGALGFPYDYAKVYAHVAQYDPGARNQSYTDAQLEQVQVVPNPYYITHEGMRSPYEGKIYFTRLPRKATISIYTTAGDLIRKFEHDEATSESPDRMGMDVWNLMTRNKQRVASQMLVAKIETPEGASVVRKFSIVVGPARIIGDSE